MWLDKNEKRIPGIIFTGDLSKTIPGTVNFYLPLISQDDLITAVYRQQTISLQQ